MEKRTWTILFDNYRAKLCVKQLTILTSVCSVN